MRVYVLIHVYVFRICLRLVITKSCNPGRWQLSLATASPCYVSDIASGNNNGATTTAGTPLASLSPATSSQEQHPHPFGHTRQLCESTRHAFRLSRGRTN